MINILSRLKAGFLYVIENPYISDMNKVVERILFMILFILSTILIFILVDKNDIYLKVPYKIKIINNKKERYRVL